MSQAELLGSRALIYKLYELHLRVPVIVNKRSGLLSTVGPPKSIFMNCTGAWLMWGASGRFGELMVTGEPVARTAVRQAKMATSTTAGSSKFI